MTVRIVLTIYFSLAFYCFGMLVLENDVNYASWSMIGDSEFPHYHQKLESLLQPLFMVPLTLLLIVSIILLWIRPENIKRHHVWIVLILVVYIIGESMMIQVPIHQQLSIRKSNELLSTLIQTHRLYRLPAEVLFFVMNVYLLHLVLPEKSTQRTN